MQCIEGLVTSNTQTCSWQILFETWRLMDPEQNAEVCSFHDNKLGGGGPFAWICMSNSSIELELSWIIIIILTLSRQYLGAWLSQVSPPPLPLASTTSHLPVFGHWRQWHPLSANKFSFKNRSHYMRSCAVDHLSSSLATMDLVNRRMQWSSSLDHIISTQTNDLSPAAVYSLFTHAFMHL